MLEKISQLPRWLRLSFIFPLLCVLFSPIFSGSGQKHSGENRPNGGVGYPITDKGGGKGLK
jgi:hypothetical protein